MRVSSTRTIVSSNGAVVSSGNGRRLGAYDRWRMSWNGHLFAPPDSGATLYLPGHPETGSTITDFSGSGNHGTITGATWRRLPSGLSYLFFDGGGAADDKVDLGNNASLFPAHGAWMIWANTPVSKSDTEQIFSTDAAGSNAGDAFLSIFVSDGKHRFSVYDGATLSIYSNAAATPNKWHFIVCLFGTGGMVMYVDGVAQTDTNASTQAPTAAQNLMMGAYRPAVADVFDGGLALGRVLNGRPSAATIGAIFERDRHLFNE